MKRRDNKKAVTRLATFMIAKLVYKNHTRILDTEMVCLPEGAKCLSFSSPVCFDEVPHDFTKCKKNDEIQQLTIA